MARLVSFSELTSARYPSRYPSVSLSLPNSRAARSAYWKPYSSAGSIWQAYCQSFQPERKMISGLPSRARPALDDAGGYGHGKSPFARGWEEG